MLPCFPASILAQANPVLTIEEDCAAIAFAPDNRLAYAVRRIIASKDIEMQRDDIWVTALDGKKKRIINGEKLVQGRAPFGYAIQSLRWSPDGTRLTVEMLTSQFVDPKGKTQEGSLTLLIDETGKEIKIQGADSIIPEGAQAAWLADSVTVVYVREAVKPKLLYSIHSLRPVAGRGAALFEKHTFAAVVWDTRKNTAVAIERNPDLSGPPKLVWLDLQKETRRELAELEGYIGQLSLSPSAKRVAYFRDQGTLEVRDLVTSSDGLRASDPVRVRMAFGSYLWAPDERRILLKRGSLEASGRRTGDLAWISLPETSGEGKLEPALYSLTFRDFVLSPDGRWLAVTAPGKRHLLVYPLQ